MTRCYVRSGGSRGRFVPVGWWCIECGQTLKEENKTPQKKNDVPLPVTKDDIEQFDKRLGLPGIGMKYVHAGVFTLGKEP